MEPLTLHDYTAAYALDALGRDEAARYEEHLATCQECQEQLARLGGAAGALAFAVESPAPPPALRSRILDAARDERPNVRPLRVERRELAGDRDDQPGGEGRRRDEEKNGQEREEAELPDVAPLALCAFAEQQAAYRSALAGLDGL